MLDQSQTCPSCRSSKYSNPQLKLMVNVCGHPLCENCVEVLFVRGSGLCVQCKTPIRKTNFRYQLFEDPLVQKEIDIRRKVLADFNKREDDFDCLEDFDLYLEKIEEIVYNLTNDVNVEETKRYIESYKKENKDIIKKNRLRPSSSLAFYEAELEREALLRQQREREELEEQHNENSGTAANDDPKNALSGRQAASITADSDKTSSNPRGGNIAPPSTVIGLRPPPTLGGLAPPSVDLSRSRFVPPTQAIGLNPTSALPGLRTLDRLSGRPPPSAFGGFVAPPSMMPLAPPSVAIGGMWSSGIHHPLHVPSMASFRKQQDTVLLPSRNSTLNLGSTTKGPTPFVYEPYHVELCGPTPPLPTNNHTRWPDIVQVYDESIIEVLQPKIATSTKSDSSDQKFKIDSQTNLMGYDINPDPTDIKPKLDEDGHMIKYSTRRSTKMEVDYEMDEKSVDKIDSDIKFAKSDDVGKMSDSDSVHSSNLVGLSHRLPPGACGIAPSVFLERCLHESRCGLFI